ncbi:hypothetical protein HKD24_04110 [Gluconobacter sp. LMG 31484]|uniref:Tail fiber protein n=1 Tax=Gluconobacter vitians TaxID=2728102 RepID=A0ABR9Y3S5_9PROT|nr:hypothetical protein [Gluconobacter vitians]MBF0858400.1 hypothetical protein [Gluconobacter vitians]
MAAPQLLDMVLETVTNPGTSSFVLNGAVADRRSFAAAAPAGGQVCYYADDGTQAEWGIGVLTPGSPNTLSRQTVIGTTQNTTQALNFTGTIRVYSFLPAKLTPVLDNDGSLTLGTMTVTAKMIVPPVDDWTAQKAVGAADADGRYIRRYADPQAAYIDQMTVRSGGVLAALANETWFTFQPSGDYATNGALKTVSDTASSALSAAGGAQGTANAALSGAQSALNTKLNATDGTATRMAISYGTMKAQFQDDGTFVLYSGDTPVFSVSSSAINWNGQSFAFLDSLPMDGSKKIIFDQVAGVAAGGRVNFPSSFSSPPKVIAQNFGTGDANCHTATTDTGGFTLHINNGGSTDITYFAIGDK